MNRPAQILMCLVLLVFHTSCETAIRPGFEGTSVMQRTEAMAVLKEWINWSNEQWSKSRLPKPGQHHVWPGIYRWELRSNSIVSHEVISIFNSVASLGPNALRVYFQNIPHLTEMPFHEVRKIKKEMDRGFPAKRLLIHGEPGKRKGYMSVGNNRVLLYSYVFLLLPDDTAQANRYLSALLSLCPNVK
jgi:hypothetical protein